MLVRARFLARHGRRWLTAGAAAACLCAASLTGTPDPEAGLPLTTAFDPAEYQGHTQVWSAAEDARGILYFGNYESVLVFDGSRWGRIPVPGGAFVRGLTRDESDVLWIGGVDELGYAAPHPDGSRSFVSLKGYLPAEAKAPGEIWRVQPMPGGALFQSNGWLLYWKDGAFLTLALPANSSWQAMRVGQETWVTSASQGWFRLEIGLSKLSLVPLPESAQIPNGALGFALPLPGGRRALLGILRKGLFLWDGQSLSPFKTDADEALASGRLYRGTRLDDGRIAVTTLESGLFLFDPEGRLLHHLDESTGLASDTVTNVLADSRGALWVCSEGGILRMDARPWLSGFGPMNGAPKAFFDSPVRVGNRVYIATTNGLYEVVPSTAQAPAHMVAVPEVRTYLNFAEPAEGGLLCGGGSGLLFFKDGQLTPVPGKSVNVYAANASKVQAGRWFVLGDGYFESVRFEKGGWTDEGRVPGLSNIRSAFEDAEGTWWLGTPSSGAFRVRFPEAGPAGPGKPEIRAVTAEEGLPPHSGWVRIVAYRNEPLLLTNNGLYPYNRTTRRFEPAAAFGTVFTDGTYAARAETDSPEGLWVAAKPPGTTELVSPVTLGLAARDGWRPFDLPELARLEDVSTVRYEEATPDRPPLLWVGGHGGIFRIDLSQGRPQGRRRLARVILVSAEASDGTALPVAGDWDLAASRDGVTVHFAAPDLATDPRLTFETVLREGSNRVVSRGASPDRDFLALATGRYLLSVRAKGNDDVWSEPLVLSFRIEPPWWLSPWASAGYVLIGLAAVTAIIRQRTGALRRRADELERIVALRTEELRRKNVELERLHKLELDEKIAAKLSEQKARLELLRYQLNPHFLMNAFTALRSLVYSKPADAAEMVGKLADFCRIALTRTDESGGTVADETQLIETYLATEKARWRNELQVEVVVEPSVLSKRLPPFLLQPLVENAIKYGGRTSPSPLQVEVRMAALGRDGVRIEVNNTGSWIEPTSPERADSTGIGLDNLRQRLARYYPQAHDLGFDHDESWVRVTLLLESEPKDPFLAARVI